MRGGVSPSAISASPANLSSPHAWGCFLDALYPKFFIDVFPTCVGVFPLCDHPRVIVIGLPHMRGGVSFAARLKLHAIGSSPHAWGCFSRKVNSICKNNVFPTCVGVFLRFQSFGNNKISLPHMRGGVSGSLTISGSTFASSPHAWGCFHLLNK